MNITFLGTAAGTPSKYRNVTSTALDLMKERKSIWLFDCGEGTQRQFMQVPLNPNKIEKIFITHLHGDHLYGLMPLISSLSLLQHTAPLTIYGPEGIRQYVETCIKITQPFITYPLEIIEITEGLIFEDERWSMHAYSLAHRVPCFGFRIQEKDRTGPLLKKKLEAAGIPVGSVYQQIKRGQDVLLADGRQIKSRDFLGDPIKGRIVAIFGDTRPTDNELLIAQNADIVVHEATVSAQKENWALEFGHCTTAHAALMAKNAQAKRLLLTHISNRYNLSDEARLLEEARAIFPATEIAHDFETFEV